MTSTTPKNQTAYFDVELPLTVDQLSAAGNLKFPSTFPSQSVPQTGMHST